MDEEQQIRLYFDAWLKQDESNLQALFDPNGVYVVCYGPEYHGFDQLLRWFRDWNLCGKVLVWDVGRFLLQGKTAAAEWYFSCVYNGESSAFDGVSLITFSDTGTIREVREFQSLHEHTRPYET